MQLCSVVFNSNGILWEIAQMLYPLEFKMLCLTNKKSYKFYKRE
jgi:hypothetical protein